MSALRRSGRLAEMMQAALQPSLQGPVILVHPCDGFVSARCTRTAAFLAGRLDGEVLGLGRGAPAEDEEEELLDGLTEVAAHSFREILRQARVSGRWVTVPRADLPTVEREAAGADLIVAARNPEEGLASENGDIRRLLMASGRPVFVCHDDGQPSADRILLCWNNSPQARRAALDALPLLRRARLVTVLTVCARVDREATTARVRQIVRGLTDRGVPAKPLAEVSIGARVTDVVREVALREGVDLVVAGAYGRGPVAHALTGSRTEELLRSVPLPLFLSR